MKIVSINTQALTLTSVFTISLTLERVQFFSSFFVYDYADKFVEQIVLTK
jgi:hypothetical protein